MEQCHGRSQAGAPRPSRPSWQLRHLAVGPAISVGAEGLAISGAKEEGTELEAQKQAGRRGQGGAPRTLSGQGLLEAGPSLPSSLLGNLQK